MFGELVQRESHSAFLHILLLHSDIGIYCIVRASFYYQNVLSLLFRFHSPNESTHTLTKLTLTNYCIARQAYGAHP